MQILGSGEVGAAGTTTDGTLSATFLPYPKKKGRFCSTPSTAVRLMTGLLLPRDHLRANMAASVVLLSLR